MSDAGIFIFGLAVCFLVGVLLWALFGALLDAKARHDLGAMFDSFNIEGGSKRYGGNKIATSHYRKGGGMIVTIKDE